ncbi:protein ORF9 [Lake sturgeon herpesvirus]|nr:protein ORF9 [Lake sturgeon herpesvirus]
MSVRDVYAFTELLHDRLMANVSLYPSLVTLLHITKHSTRTSLQNAYKVIWIDLKHIYEQLYNLITDDKLVMYVPSRPSPVLWAHPLYIFLTSCCKWLNNRAYNMDHIIVDVRKIQQGYQQLQYANYPEVDVERLTFLETKVVEQLYAFIQAVLQKSLKNIY